MKYFPGTKFFWKILNKIIFFLILIFFLIKNPIFLIEKDNFHQIWSKETFHENNIIS